MIVGTLYLLYGSSVVRPSDIQQHQRRQQQQQQDQHVLDELASRILNRKQNDLEQSKNEEKTMQGPQDELLKSLTKRDDDRRETDEVSTKATLKREILHALIKLLHDELEKQSSLEQQQRQQQQQRKEVNQQREALHDVRNDASKDTIADEFTVQEATNDAAAAAAKSQLEDEKRPPRSAKRFGKNSKDSKDLERRTIDDLMSRELIRGPPGLWGRDAIDTPRALGRHTKDDSEKRELIRGPPGLWGRDMVDLKDELMRERKDFFRKIEEEGKEERKSKV